jgi:cytochrome c-type protein NapC
MTPRLISLAAVTLAALFAAPAVHAAVDWASVPGREVLLFYPGQASWEWALTPGDMIGAEKFRQEGTACRTCHDGEEKKIGPAIASGKLWTDEKGDQHPPIESKPIPGKPGWLAATVKFANDGTTLYVHLDFTEGAQPNAGQNPNSDTLVSVMFSAAKTADIMRAGCFAACHDDSAGMPSNKSEARTMYLAATHAHLTRQGGGDALKPAGDLAKLQADGYFMEYWQAELNPGQPARAQDGIIFDKRTQTPDAVTAEATFANGGWSVTLSRKLAGASGQISFTPGTHYTISFAIHAGHTAGRYHYISNERDFSINSGSGDFVAIKK